MNEAHSASSSEDLPVPNDTIELEHEVEKGMISISSEAARLDGSDDGNPRNWSVKKKCGTASFALLGAFVATFGTPIYIAAIPSIAHDFKVGTILSITPASLYAYGIAVEALLGTAACEIFGRRIVYQITVLLSLIFTILGGAATNFTTMATARTLSGVFSGPCLTVGVGVLNDLWDLSLDKTGTTFTVLYALFIIYATQIGPMVSASMMHHSWRWKFWLVAIFLGIMTAAVFLIPETYAPQIQRVRAKKEKKEVSERAPLYLFLVSIGRPLHMILFEPLIFPSGLILSITQSIIFAYYVIYAILFEKVYGFTQYQVGMSFAPVLVGGVIAVPIVAAFDRLTYQKAREYAIASGTKVHPEIRLYPAILGAILLPVSLFWLAWTGRKEVHWIVPVLSGIPFGISYVLNMLCLPVYNNDVYTTHYGASVMAATTFMRFIISSSFPLFMPQMVQNLGFAWATSLLGFITILMMPVPWVFFKWGPVLRSRSVYLRVLE